MAGTTPKGFPYPTVGDAPNIATDIQALATAVDTEFNDYAGATSPTFTGGVVISSGALEIPTQIIFEGSVADGFETTLTLTNPTSDRTITLPNVSGTVVTTGDTASVSLTMLSALVKDEILDNARATSFMLGGL